MSARTSRNARRRAAGYSLVELLVSLTVFIGILVAVLFMFNFNYKLARVQTHVTDMQQSLRIAQHDLVRMVRMAGRGGLPRGPLPLGLALQVRKNVADGTMIGAAGTPRVLAETDILTIRGVFSTPFYQVNPAGGNFTLDNPGAPSAGTVRIQNPNPQTGVIQDLTELAAGVEALAPIAEPLLLVSPLDDSIFAVVEVNPGGSSVERLGGQVTAVTLAFDIVNKYKPLSTGNDYPLALTNVAFVGVLEEYRYYVREAYAVPGDNTTELVPRLTMARFFPSTDDPYAGDASNLTVDLADNILDFQVALGIDTNDSDQIDENPANPEDDEWLYNDGGDDDTEARWNQVPLTGAVPDLFYVRLTTLARTDRPDFKYVSPLIDELEDHDLPEQDPPANLAELQRRRYRRWLLQTVVDLRNI